MEVATAENVSDRIYGLSRIETGERKESAEELPGLMPEAPAMAGELARAMAEGKKQEAVIFRKTFEDGTMCCAGIDWFSRGKGRDERKFQTMWKERPEGEN